MRALMLVEHDNLVMSPVNRNVLQALLSMSMDVTLLVVGHQCAAVAEQAASLLGVKTVLLLDKAAFEHQLAESLADCVVKLAPSFDYIVAASTSYGKNILPRVAALLDVAMVSDVTAFIDAETVEHPIYAGNAIETLRLLDKIKVMSIRTTAFPAVCASQSACAIEHIDADLVSNLSEFVRLEHSPSIRPELSTASRVVSGGRGLQNAEKFKLVEELADVLGAAVGASRAAVDAGFVANEYQVGQTGKVVAPELYIAVGISGAIQHLAGMKDSKIIVAINKDKEAPIFQIATYGLVGDLFELIPSLIDELKKLKSH